jgi:hypothetical protein
MKRMLSSSCRPRFLFLALASVMLGLSACDRNSDVPGGSASPTNTTGEIDATASDQDSPLTIEPAELDMGDLLPNTPVEKMVRLTNTGSKPLKIVKALADCGCTTPTWPEEPIAPGASVETAITMDAGTQQGVELIKRVTFDIEGMDPAFLTVKGRVAKFLTFGPTTLEGPIDGATELPSGDVSIESADGQEFAVIAVEPDVVTPLATARALRQQVTVDWEKWRAAGKPVRVVIETDHPIAPTLGIIIRRSMRGNPANSTTDQGSTQSKSE